MNTKIQQVLRPVRKYTPFYNGYYTCNGKFFESLYPAHCESLLSNSKVDWVFHNDTFCKIPNESIDLTLPQLYHARAQQLRDNYDYVCLLFSGGVDSNQVLHAFIDNNIFIDEILIHRPERFERHINNVDRSHGNVWSETKYSAEARLNVYKHSLNPKTKITFFDSYGRAENVLGQNHWWENFTAHCSPTLHGIARNSQPLDHQTLLLLDNDKRVCYIAGVDKPSVKYYRGSYYGFFPDTNMRHAHQSHDELSGSYATNAVFEPFFWTPDMPEIVWKQWQEVVRVAEVWPTLKNACRQMEGVHAQDLRYLLNTIIYQKHVFPYWETEKNKGNTKLDGIDKNSFVRPIDRYLWVSMDSKLQKNYMQGIEYFNQGSVGLDYWNNTGFEAINIGYYKI